MERTRKKTQINEQGLPNIVIPAEVLFNPNLSPREMILFGHLNNMAYNEYGYCWPGNRYLSRLIGVAPETISTMLSKLAKEQYLILEYEVTYDGQNIRKIYINKKYPEVYNNILKGTYEKLKSSNSLRKNPLRKNQRGIKEILNTPKGKSKDPLRKSLRNIDIDIEKDIEKPPLNFNHTWKSLSEKYDSSKVSFVRWFLKKQQKNFPKLIKGKISPNHERVLNSLDVLDKLCRLDGFDFEEDVRPVLSQVPDDPFWSRNLLSLSSLRRKSKSNGEIKFVNIQNTLSQSSLKQISSKSPEEVLRDYFPDRGYIQNDIMKSVIDPVLSMLPTSNNGTAVQITEAVCALYSWLDKNQRRPHYDQIPDVNDQFYYVYSKWANVIPVPMEILTEYVRWLERQNWIDQIKPAHFRPGGTVLKNFIHEYSKRIGYDLFTGHDIGH